MKELFSDVIYKYTGIKADSKENLLDLPIIREYWLYILIELEDTYKIPVIRALESIQSDEFSIGKLEEVLTSGLRQCENQDLINL